MMRNIGRIVAMAMVTIVAQSVAAQKLEALDRGLVGVKVEKGVFLSWRLLATDEKDVAFDVLRNGEKLNAEPLTTVTNYTDTLATDSAKYAIEVLPSHERVELKSIWQKDGYEIRLDTPKGQGPETEYTPNDITVGDMDGDGEYELVMKWDPRNSKDNSHWGRTSSVIIDCLKLDGRRLWRIDLGPNIRAGAHYTQMACFDFDGDGRGELMVKTAPGCTDGNGQYASEAATDETIRTADNSKVYVNERGDILTGPEWLTVFDGQTGRAVHTVYYCPSRDQGYNTTAEGATYTERWGDAYGNRGERYLCGVAHLSNETNASAIMSRGYYTQAFVWAVDFDGEHLKTRWVHESCDTEQYSVVDSLGNRQTYTAPACTSARENGSKTLFGNGNHNLSVADVDDDGLDEIIYGAAALDHDGSLLYSTGYGHGDAIHLADLIPSRPGLEVFDVHENHLPAELGSWDIHDARTGEIIHHGGNADVDNGRGIALQLLPNERDCFFASADDRKLRSCTTGEVVSDKYVASVNFRVYWTGELRDEFLNGSRIEAFDGTTFSSVAQLRGRSCNFSKRTPNLSGDIVGDWREEVILWQGSPEEGYSLIVHTSTIATPYRISTLTHDHTYRMGLTWQNTAYNQPPHVGKFLPDMVK